MKEKETKKCCGCGCWVASWLSLIISACILIGGAVRGTCLYNKVSTIYDSTITAQFLTKENFDKYYWALTNSEEYAEYVKSNIDGIISQFGGETTSNTNEGGAAVVEGNDAYSNVSTSAAFNDPRWNDNSNEAYEIFWIGWTPGNAIIDMKTRNYKVIGWAYPKESFDTVIAQLRNWEALTTDDMGNAGTLTEDQLNKLLANAHFKNDNTNADIVIIEYSDLLCPFCKRHYNDRTIESIIEADNSVALVFKNMPLPQLHPNAPLGAKGAECAAQLNWTDAFYNYLDSAFAQDDFSASNVVTIAEQQGLDVDAFIKCFEN